uniref:Putative camp-dependent protein kinase inhibitor n=1 Tax=Anopheles marajoara TaxID=58244 RepID=A0A2M4C4Z0_9DIPT
MDKLADDPTGGGGSIRQQAGVAPGEGEEVGVVGAKREGDRPSDEYHHQFYNTGRIGRRNALPDILGTHCTTTTADLSSQLGALSTSECTGKSPEDGSLAPANNGAQPPTTTAT